MRHLVGWLVSFNLGLLLSSAVRQPSSYAAPDLDILREHVEQRVYRQRRVVEEHPTWEGQAELLRFLCEQQDRELVLAFHQEPVPAEARQPTPEQIELLNLLERTARTSAQRRTAGRLRGRMSYQQDWK